MTTKKIAISIVAFLSIFVFLAVSPVGAKDELETAQDKSSITEAADAGKATVKDASTEKININKADLSALSKLKGIGPETAQNIITYRQEVGSFETMEDLMKVKGVGEKTFEEIKPFINVH